MSDVKKAYELAKKAYAKYGVDTDAVIEKMKSFNLSIHCWQGDDVSGFEHDEAVATGGLVSTGNFPGKARTPEQLRSDIEEVLKYLPGKHSISIHAMYAEPVDGKPVDRGNLTKENFQNWVDWAKKNDIGLDFNHTFFGHPMADSGFTLSSPDEEIRSYWVNHAKQCREIANWIGEQTGRTCVNNLWIQDGSKEVPVRRGLYRKQLLKSLDEILEQKYEHTVDSLECKLFGIGAESYTVGSSEIYMGYAAKNNTALTLDLGHFHPTENVDDKISSVLLYCDKILLHISRGVRWDSDHAPILNDETISLLKEIKRCDAFDRTFVGLDFFDASINRMIAWLVGAKSVLKSTMMALLEPTDVLAKYEEENKLGERLALNEELKFMPYQAVWDMLNEELGLPVGDDWIEEVKKYTDVTIKARG